MIWGAIYGLLTGGVLLLTWASRSVVLQKLGLLMLLSWAACNLAVETLGFGRAAIAIPSLDAAVALLVAWTGFTYRSRAALVVFAVFLLVGAVHVSAFVLRQEATHAYYLTLNLLSLAQLFAIGGPSAWLAVRRWAVPRGQRLRPDLARR